MANKTTFKYLSLKEEAKLTQEEKQKYIKNLREYALSRKLTNTTKGAITLCPKIKKGVEKIAVGVTKALAGGNIEVVVDGLENIPDGAVIFASTHQSVLDTFCYIPHCPKHCVILHNSDVNKLLLLAQADIGLVLVSKVEEETENRINAKLDMVKRSLNLVVPGRNVEFVTKQITLTNEFWVFRACTKNTSTCCARSYGMYLRFFNRKRTCNKITHKLWQTSCSQRTRQLKRKTYRIRRNYFNFKVAVARRKRRIHKDQNNQQRIYKLFKR